LEDNCGDSAIVHKISEKIHEPAAERVVRDEKVGQLEVVFSKYDRGG
jgi:hypothetical protein